MCVTWVTRGCPFLWFQLHQWTFRDLASGQDWWGREDSWDNYSLKPNFDSNGRSQQKGEFLWSPPPIHPLNCKGTLSLAVTNTHTPQTQTPTFSHQICSHDFLLLIFWHVAKASSSLVFECAELFISLALGQRWDLGQPCLMKLPCTTMKHMNISIFHFDVNLRKLCKHWRVSA